MEVLKRVDALIELLQDMTSLELSRAVEMLMETDRGESIIENIEGHIRTERYVRKMPMPAEAPIEDESMQWFVDRVN